MAIIHSDLVFISWASLVGLEFQTVKRMSVGRKSIRRLAQMLCHAAAKQTHMTTKNHTAQCTSAGPIV